MKRLYTTDMKVFIIKPFFSNHDYIRGYVLDRFCKVISCTSIYLCKALAERNDILGKSIHDIEYFSHKDESSWVYFGDDLV